MTHRAETLLLLILTAICAASLLGAEQAVVVQTKVAPVSPVSPVQSFNAKTLAAEIDQVILAKLKTLEQAPRVAVDDYTFVRRVHLDLIGRIPTLAELQAFINDAAPGKRAKLISTLLKSKGHNSHFYNYWAELLRVKSLGDQLHHAGNLSQAIKTAVRENKPYNQFTHELVAAKGDLYKKGNGAAGYKARESMQLDRLANTVKSFMGLAIDCAQCHDHPFDDWTQLEFYRLAAFTSNIKLRVDPPGPLEKERYATIRKALKQEDFDKWIVYREALRMKYATISGTGTGYQRLPHDYKYEDGKPHEVMTAHYLFGSAPKLGYKVPQTVVAKHKKNNFVGPDIDSQVQLADWLASPDNAMFNKTTVNRLWKWVMGTELVGPLGDLRIDSDGTHPELTNKMIAVLKQVDYDVRAFYEVILNTRAYQSRALPVRHDSPEYRFDGPLIRRLSAEATWDSMLSLREPEPDKYVPTQFHYDGFTDFNEKSQSWTAEDFEKYAREGGFNRGKFYAATHKEAVKRNPDTGKPHERRASESLYGAEGPNQNAIEVGKLFGASTRELIDGSNTDPSIPQVLYLMNGKPESDIIAGRSVLNANLRQAKPGKKYNLLWLSILSRPITPEESTIAARSGHSPKGLQDLAWALVNSNEFRFVR